MSKRRLLLACFALATTATASADYSPTSVIWPGWCIHSGEDIYIQPGRNHPKYPLTHLFDGDPATCWVYAGKANPQYEWCKPQPYIEIVPDKPLTVDAIRIINGYAKSADLYAANDRAGRVRVTVNSNPYHGYPKDAEKADVSADLAETTEFQTIKLPPRLVHTLRVEVTQVRAGRVHDLCISEIELLRNGRKIDMKLPAVVNFSAGDECGCGQTWDLVARNGKLLFGNTGYHPAYDATKRYLADIRLDDDRPAGFYVVDTRTGRVLFEQTIRRHRGYGGLVARKVDDGQFGGADRITWAGRKVSYQPGERGVEPIQFELPPEPKPAASQPEAPPY